MVTHLDGTDTDAFFRYFLIAALKKRVTKSKVVADFKTLFMNEVAEAANLSDRHLYVNEEEDEEDEGVTEASDGEDILLKRKASGTVSFKAFLNRVVLNAKAFGQLVLAKTGDAHIDRHLRNLRMIKAAQTYGFLMYLRVGKIDDKQFITVLTLTENFVLRRHICRERNNETESLFAKLCLVDPRNAVVETKKSYRNACPADERFKEDFATIDFSNTIDRARYCLEKIESRKHGNNAELRVEGADSVHVEHIIPQKIKTKKAKDEFGDWIEYLGDNAETQHSKLVSKIGNLTLFSGPLNISASNNPFARKKAEYKKSGIEITKELGEMRNFKFKQLIARSKRLAELAVTIWPRP